MYLLTKEELEACLVKLREQMRVCNVKHMGKLSVWVGRVQAQLDLMDGKGKVVRPSLFEAWPDMDWLSPWKGGDDAA